MFLYVCSAHAQETIDSISDILSQMNRKVLDWQTTEWIQGSLCVSPDIVQVDACVQRLWCLRRSSTALLWSHTLQ